MNANVNIDTGAMVEDVEKWIFGSGKKGDGTYDLSDLVRRNKNNKFGDLINKIASVEGKNDHLSDVAEHFIRSLITTYYYSEGTDFVSGQISRDALRSMDFEKDISAGEVSINDDGVIKVEVKVEYDKSTVKRESVLPERYSRGVDNIIELLNGGYKTKRLRRVRGKWHSNKIYTIPKRKGAKFLDEAINYYMEHYAAEDGAYNVEKIQQ